MERRKGNGLGWEEEKKERINRWTGRINRWTGRRKKVKVVERGK